MGTFAKTQFARRFPRAISGCPRQIVISSMTTWACSDYVAGIKDNNMGNKYCGRECGERCARGDRGEALIRAIQNAQEGTTIKIANPVEVYEDIDVFRAVRLVGSSSAPLEMGEKSLAVSKESTLEPAGDNMLPSWHMSFPLSVIAEC